MKKILVMCGIWSLFLTGCLAPVQKIERHDVMVNNAADVRAGIFRGCAKHGWIPVEIGDGEIEASLSKRGHKVVVDITYDAGYYAIDYKDSQNMTYNAKRNKIHRKYNQWLNNLDFSISQELL